MQLLVARYRPVDAIACDTLEAGEKTWPLPIYATLTGPGAREFTDGRELPDI